jgi:hypothetical protein
MGGCASSQTKEALRFESGQSQLQWHRNPELDLTNRMLGLQTPASRPAPQCAACRRVWARLEGLGEVQNSDSH